MRVSVVGLGPGRLDWITPAARSKLHAPNARVFVRTRLIPGLAGLLDGVAWESFATVYDTAASFDEVHAAILGRVLSASASRPCPHRPRPRPRRRRRRTTRW